MIIPIDEKSRIVGTELTWESQREGKGNGGCTASQCDSPQIGTRAVLVPDENGALILCYATVIDESELLGRLLWAPYSGPFRDGDSIQYCWMPNNSVPVVTVGFGPGGIERQPGRGDTR